MTLDGIAIEKVSEGKGTMMTSEMTLALVRHTCKQQLLKNGEEQEKR